MSIILSLSFISFFLESIVSNIFNVNIVFSLICIVICYPFFKNNDQQYYLYAFLFGIIYDLTYTDTILFNATLFVLVALFIKRINLMISNNYITVLLIAFLSIVYYRLLSYIALVLVGYLPINFSLLLRSITDSLLINLGYTFFIYLIADYFSKKYRIIKID